MKQGGLLRSERVCACVRDERGKIKEKEKKKMTNNKSFSRFGISNKLEKSRLGRF